jgi:hypothetical protein
MRLTLRTMLAYMDGILEPEDAEDIAKKIQESEYATKLMHRARDVVRRLRLSAPSLTDRGPGLDPNTVAEYLDNTLSDDRVPDFEKVCLDSDIHLAEVASCHQILTLVLGEPAEIDPAARQRMYNLPQALAAQAVPAAPLPAPMPMKSDGEPRFAAQPRPRHRPEVPDYLRKSGGRLRYLPLAVALLLMVIVGALAAAGVGPFASGTFLGDHVDRLLARGPVEDESPSPAKGPVERPLKTGAAEEPGKEEPAKLTQPDLTPPKKTDDGSAEEPPLPTEKTGKTVEPKGKEVEEPAPEPGLLPEKPGVGPEKKLAPEPEVKVPPRPVGIFTTEKQVLLRSDPAGNDWIRLAAPQGIVSSGDRLLALPTYQPVIALTAGVNVQLAAGSDIELLPPLGPGDGIPGVKLLRGRLVIRSVGKAGVKLVLEVNGRSGIVTFDDAVASGAVETIRVRAPGTDPETAPGAVVTNLYAQKGALSWSEGADRQPIAVAAPARLTLGQQPVRTALTAEQLPSWITGEPLGSWDQLASPELEKSLAIDAPVMKNLREMTSHRRKEVSWLVIRSLGTLGQFGHMVAMLNSEDKDRKQFWIDCADQLQEAVNRDTETAAAVHKLFDKDFGPAAPDLYRMLWGYTEKDLRGGQAKLLVDYLDHRVLAYRVLGFWALQRLTGGWKLTYAPDLLPENKRVAAVNVWRKRLESGEFYTRVVPRLGAAAASAASAPADGEEPPP